MKALVTAGDTLREAQRRLPEATGLARCPENAVCLADTVAVETLALAREAAEADRDLVFRVLDLWSDLLAQPALEADLRCAVTGALGLLRVADQPYAREARARATPGMRRWMTEAPQRINPLSRDTRPCGP